jgi:hypothetical protein
MKKKRRRRSKQRSKKMASFLVPRKVPSIYLRKRIEFTSEFNREAKRKLKRI